MANEVMNCLLTRYSCKKYKPDMVPKDLIDQVIEAGITAPIGRGSNSPIVLAVTDRAVRDRLSKINADVMGAEIDPFYGAPVVLIVLADKNKAERVYDGSCAMENMQIAAHGLGLGACWIHRAKEMFEQDECKQLLKDCGIEGEYEGIGNCILGYPDGEPVVKSQKHKGAVYYI